MNNNKQVWAVKKQFHFYPDAPRTKEDYFLVTPRLKTMVFENKEDAEKLAEKLKKSVAYIPDPEECSLATYKAESIEFSEKTTKLTFEQACIILGIHDQYRFDL